LVEHTSEGKSTMQPTKLKEGDERHIKGFVLNKLYLGGYYGKKHIDVDDIPKGYPLEHRGKFSKLVNELKKEGFINVFPHGSKKKAYAIWESIDLGLTLCNAFRESVNLPPLNKKFREIAK
jgi:hypothetical protein